MEQVPKSKFHFRDQLADKMLVHRLCALLQNDEDDYDKTKSSIATTVSMLPPNSAGPLAEMKATTHFSEENKVHSVRIARSKRFFDPVALVPYVIALDLCVAVYFIANLVVISLFAWFDHLPV
jgi:hypothetical protein